MALFLSIPIALALLPIIVLNLPSSADGLSTNQALPDLSGISWIDNDTFLAVHDAKFPSEAASPRANLLTLPSQLGGTVITPLNVSWPQGEDPGSDKECIAKIPDSGQPQDTARFLIGESGDNARGSQRIFLFELNNDTLRGIDSVPWPAQIHNVEGCAVTTVNDELTFLFAERGQGSQNTSIDWATLNLDPLGFGPVNSIDYRIPSEQGAEIDPGFRPVAALEIDDAGNIFIASAIDPDVDTGPFASEVWLAGHINPDQDPSGSPISLLDSPERLATLDGLKVEGLAARPATNGSGTELIIGTDDEFSGGVLRILPRIMSTDTASLANQ